MVRSLRVCARSEGNGSLNEMECTCSRVGFVKQRLQKRLALLDESSPNDRQVRP